MVDGALGMYTLVSDKNNIVKHSGQVEVQRLEMFVVL